MVIKEKRMTAEANRNDLEQNFQSQAFSKEAMF
jgi:hypothetical protein